MLSSSYVNVKLLFVGEAAEDADRASKPGDALQRVSLAIVGEREAMLGLDWMLVRREVLLGSIKLEIFLKNEVRRCES